MVLMYNGMKYAVVVYQNFDADTPIYLFDSYAKAKEYLHDMWEHCYNTELAESIIDIDEEQTYHEDDFAQIQWVDGDCMLFILTATSEPMKIGGKDYK
jgi:hypothetical protein